MTATTPPAPDLVAIKSRQQQTWSSGDYHVIATRIAPMAELLCDAADLRAGDRVLDIACGSGNATIAAARCGCDVTGIDYVPELLDRARARAAAEGLEATFIEADAEALPFPDSSFDAVISVVGVMFAPNQERAAAELVRVCRTGGTIALANWVPDGFIGELLRTVGKHVQPPAGLKPPPLWGTEERVRELLGDRVSSLTPKRRAFVFRFRSPEDLVDTFRTYYGPTLKAFEALEEDGRGRLYDDFLALVRRYDRGQDGAVAIPSDYLEVVAVRR